MRGNRGVYGTFTTVLFDQTYYQSDLQVPQGGRYLHCKFFTEVELCSEGVCIKYEVLSAYVRTTADLAGLIFCWVVVKSQDIHNRVISAHVTARDVNDYSSFFS